ncbi:MAG: response regulator [Candidatus Kryptoniota bacterium]
MTDSELSNRPLVLVLDDDTNILLAFQDFMKKEGCEMVAVSSPQEALLLLEKQHFDLLISDLRLNYESGVTFVIRAKKIRHNIPLIVITGYPDTISEDELRNYGADYLLIKPLELKDLQHAVRSCLQRNQTEEFRS